MVISVGIIADLIVATTTDLVPAGLKSVLGRRHIVRVDPVARADRIPVRVGLALPRPPPDGLVLRLLALAGQAALSPLPASSRSLIG